jgi:hypothetical protein
LRREEPLEVVPQSALDGSTYERLAVRNVTTTYEYMDAIAELAGWRVLEWYVGDAERIPLRSDPSHLAALGQSICVLGT